MVKASAPLFLAACLILAVAPLAHAQELDLATGNRGPAWGFSPLGPNQDWELTASNSWIRDIPTVYDFMPLGVTCIETEDHRIIYPPDDPQWRLR